MKCCSYLGKILPLALALLLYLVDKSCASYFHGRNYKTNNECPHGTRCMVISSCHLSIFRSPKQPLQECSNSFIWRRKICCPEKRLFGQPTSDVPRFEPVTPRPITPTDCGKVNALQGVKAEKNPAKQGAWPWMVEIAKRSYGVFIHICSGFMITRRHVLTAAHCFTRRKPSQYVARIGHVNRNLGHVYKISRIITPDNFQHSRYYDDIAVVTLSRDVNTKYVSPICLPLNSDDISLVGNTTTSVGWGAIKPKSLRSTVLFELPGIPIISNSRCSDIFKQKLRNFRRDFPRGITNGLICAGLLEGRRGKCWGESGEPMMYQQGGRWYAVGVLSFGVHSDCHQPGIPTGYTRVSKYLNWILQNIKD